MWAILGIACVASGIYSARLLHSAGAIAFQGRPGGTSGIPKYPKQTFQYIPKITVKLV